MTPKGNGAIIRGRGLHYPRLDGGGRYWGGGLARGLGGGFGGKAVPPGEAGGARLAARIEACAVHNTPCWTAVRAGAFVCKKSLNSLKNCGTRNQILHCMQQNHFQPVCGDSCRRLGTRERQIINCIQSSHLNFIVRNGNTYGDAPCMGCQDELFQIGREHWHRSLSQHTTQNFLPRLDRGIVRTKSDDRWTMVQAVVRRR